MEDPRDTAILNALKSGRSFQDLVREFVPAEEPQRDELAMRAALVSHFDETLYRDELARGLTAPTFAEFVQRPEVERVSRSESEYRLAEDARRQWSRFWPEAERKDFRK